jgi:cytochrome c556
MANLTRPAIAIGCFMLATVGLSVSAQEGSSKAADLKPLVSIMELMQQTITPATNQLWSAWEEPSTPAEWRLMEEAAVTLLAASSLTAAGGTGPMDNEWVKSAAWQGLNAAMVAAGQAALTASRNKDPEALLAAGDLLLPPCEACHQQFNPAVVNAE